MSDIADGAAVRIVLADYIGVDAANKANIIGAGIQLLGFEPASGTTTPFSVLVMISFLPSDVGESPAIEVVLEDTSGEPVAMPLPAGVTGEPQVLRIANAAQLEESLVPGTFIPKGTLRPRSQLVLAFPNGLPLTLGQLYRWRVKIDHKTRDDWTEYFYVPGPNPGPVLG